MEENSSETYLNKSPNDLANALSNMFPDKEIIKVSEDAIIPEGVIKDKIYVFCDDLFKVVSYIIVF